MNKNKEQLWQEILNELRQKLGEQDKGKFESTIKLLKVKEADPDQLVLEAHNEFTQKLALNRQYDRLIQDVCQSLYSPEMQVKITVSDHVNELGRISDPTPISTPQAPPEGKRQLLQNHNLNAQFTFNNFVVGSHNKHAHATAWRVAESPGTAFNPLFIHGGVGLGKTHLLKAIGYHLITQRSNFKVAYTTSERFANELINAIKDNTTLEFKNRYRKVDLLLIDDIQFIAGKESTQEEFFHTFNELYELSKQIVLTSDRSPDQIATLEDRLRSRFAIGMICDIQAPELETRIAILKKKAEMQRFEVPDEVLHYIAQVYKSNVRELEGALTRVMALASVDETVPTLSYARSILGQMPEREMTPKSIQETVAKYYHLTPEDLRGKSRSKSINQARQVAIYLCCELTELSTPRLGDAFGGRDHTTILHARDQIKKKMPQDTKLKDDINELMKRFN